MRARFERLASAAASRPVLALGVVLVLALSGGLFALGLAPDAATDTFVNSSSASYQATQDDHSHFGGDAVVVLIREKLADLVETKDLATLSQLEACLAGQTLVANQTLGSFTPATAGTQRPYGGWSSPCGQLARTRPIQVVYGPGTFLNRAVAAVNVQVRAMLQNAQTAVTRYASAAYQLAIAKGLSRKQAQQAARDAGTLEYQQQLQSIEQAYLSSGISGTPRIDDPQFIPQIVFDATRGVGQPKARFAYLFPTSGSALIQARLRPGLSAAQQSQTIALIREAVAMPLFRLRYGGTYTVSGVPVVINDLPTEITGSITTLLIGVLIVMAIALLLVFKSRLRLLPLGIALAAAGITFGATSLLGGSLTLASIAVLPILIGLAVDYAIQFQSRAQEAAQTRSGERLAPEQAVAAAAARGAPTIATAALATGVGFLVLELSPVPMVRGFGLLLVVGIAIALALALIAGSAALALADRDEASWDGGRLGASARGAGEILGVWVTGAGSILADAGGRRAARALGRAAARAGACRRSRCATPGGCSR